MKRKRRHFTTKHTHLKSGMRKQIKQPINHFKERYNRIEQPKSVEEFKTNLLKYYLSDGNKILTQELGYVNVDTLTCIQDLVNKVQSKGYTSLNLTPKVVELKKWSSYVKNNTTSIDILKPELFCEQFWTKDDTHIIIPNSWKFMEVCPKITGSISWKNILELRELYQFYHHKVMGEYGLIPDFQMTKKIIYSII